jgi:type III restriction enzyme
VSLQRVGRTARRSAAGIGPVLGIPVPIAGLFSVTGVETELERDDVRFWLRNFDRKTWALTVPHENAGQYAPLYPDFLIVRETKNGHLVVDLLDPHSIGLADAPAKAAGLARYTAKHAPDFGRIELIIVKDKQLRRLNLKDETVRAKVAAVQTTAHLQQLFDDTGP